LNISDNYLNESLKKIDLIKENEISKSIRMEDDFDKKRIFGISFDSLDPPIPFIIGITLYIIKLKKNL
jgi:hypothetical protein